MLQSEAEITAVLHGTLLQGREVVRVEPPGPGYEAVLAVDVQGLDLFQAWQVLREKVGQTGRWPVLAIDWFGGNPNFRNSVNTTDWFSRSPFSGEAGERSGDAPADILTAAQGVDLVAGLARLAEGEDDSLSVEEWVSCAQSDTQFNWGHAPQIDDAAVFAREQGLSTHEQIEDWFLRWELAHGAALTEVPALGWTYQAWFEPRTEYPILLLMPFTEGEATLAYMNWYASERSNSQFLVALLRSWREKYGAELVAHYGTMLQFVVARPPTTIEDAFALAQEHALVAPCTLILPGVSLRHHARALLQLDRWFLHERP